jgi:hypothetical protein
VQQRRTLNGLRPLMGIALLLVATLTSAADQPKTAVSSKNKATDFRHTQGVRLLEEASAEAGAFEPASQAGLLFIVGEVYAKVDKVKARSAFEAAYQNVRAGIEARPAAVGFMVPDLILKTVQFSPEMVEQSLPQGWYRDFALSHLAQHYIRQKQLNRAIELLGIIERDEDLTNPARDLLMALRNAPHEDRDQVFSIVLRAYTATHHQQVRTGSPEDLGTLVVRFWRGLNPALVHQAIDELLSQAKDVKDNIVMNTSQGTAAFSAYQFRLFQIFPALQAIDPDQASALLKKETETAAALKKYPQGQQTVDPWLRDTPMKDGEKQETRYTIARDSGTALTAATSMEIDRSVDDLVAKAKADPNTAIANATRISDAGTRVRLLVRLARVCATDNPTAAKRALREAATVALSNTLTASSMKEVAEVALQLGDTGIADTAVKTGLKVARREYDDDANPDNPNDALKLYWQSVSDYRELIATQAKFSPDSALETLKNLPDIEIIALEKAMLAAAWLDAPLSGTSPMVMKRHRSGGGQ